MLRRTLSSLLALGLMVLVLSGCFKADYALTINEDETISGTLTMAMHKQAIQTMASFDTEGGSSDPMDPRQAWDMMMGDDASAPPGAVKEPYEDGDFIGDKYTFSDVPIDEFLEFIEEDSGGDEFELEHVDGTYVFRATTDMSDVTGSGDGSGEELFGQAEMEQFYALYGTPTFTMSMTFPGKVIEHNGELDGTTVTWTADMTAAEVVEFTAAAEDSGGAVPGGSGEGDEGSGGEGTSGGAGEEGAGDGTAGENAGDDTDEASGAASDSDDDGFPVLPLVIGLAVLIVILIGAIITILLRSKKQA